MKSENVKQRCFEKKVKIRVRYQENKSEIRFKNVNRLFGKKVKIRVRYWEKKSEIRFKNVKQTF